MVLGRCIDVLICLVLHGVVGDEIPWGRLGGEGLGVLGLSIMIALLLSFSTPPSKR
jgi:hypothetical protein